MVAHVPTLLLVGANDEAMPPILAERTYRDLREWCHERVTLRIIEDEGHQYRRFDAFDIMDAWIRSGGGTTELARTPDDVRLREAYARDAELRVSVNALSWEGGDHEKALSSFHAMKSAGLEEPQLWFKLGIVLFTDRLHQESLEAFLEVAAMESPGRCAAMVWVGHIHDMEGRRQDALAWYTSALEHYPGFPIVHGQWNITIDRDWIAVRLAEPFKGVEAH